MSETGFKRCTEGTLDNGTYTITCKLGLWSVSGTNHIDILNEAARYYVLYRGDGEYDKLLGDSVERP